MRLFRPRISLFRPRTASSGGAPAGGGGAGAISGLRFTLSAGDSMTLALTVGAGGAGGLGMANGTAGGSSTVVLTTGGGAVATVTAAGGSGGLYNWDPFPGSSSIAGGATGRCGGRSWALPAMLRPPANPGRSHAPASCTVPRHCHSLRFRPRPPLCPSCTAASTIFTCHSPVFTRGGTGDAQGGSANKGGGGGGGIGASNADSSDSTAAGGDGAPAAPSAIAAQHVFMTAVSLAGLSLASGAPPEGQVS